MEKVFFQKILDTTSYRFYKYAKEDLQVFARFLYTYSSDANYWKNFWKEHDYVEINNDLIVSLTGENKVRVYDCLEFYFPIDEDKPRITLADCSYFETAMENFIHFIDEWNRLRESNIPEIRLIRDDTGKIWLEGGQKTPLPESDSVKIHDSWKE